MSKRNFFQEIDWKWTLIAWGFCIGTCVLVSVLTGNNVFHGAMAGFIPIAFVILVAAIWRVVGKSKRQP